MRKLSEKRALVKPAGVWPDNWGDSVHEDDGGCDEVGMSIGGCPQEGCDILKHLLAKLSNKDGQDIAWDDVTNEDLEPQLVRKARATELEFFRKMNV